MKHMRKRWLAFVLAFVLIAEILYGHLGDTLTIQAWASAPSDVEIVTETTESVAGDMTETPSTVASSDASEETSTTPQTDVEETPSTTPQTDVEETASTPQPSESSTNVTEENTTQENTTEENGGEVTATEETTEEAEGSEAVEGVEENETEEEETEEEAWEEIVVFNAQARVSPGTSIIPTSAADLGATTTYYITSYQDWINLQALSKTTDLAGYSFLIIGRSVEGSGSVANYDLTFSDVETTEVFEGLGNETYPFAGTLYAADAGGILLTLDRPLFNYLSTEASIHHLKLQPQNGACAGLAENLVVKSAAFTEFSDISVSHTDAAHLQTGITNAGGVAGGLFANVTNDMPDTTFVLGGANISVDCYVTGNIAGGLIGTVAGKVTVDMTGITYAPYTAASGANAVAGGLVGKVGNTNIATEFTLTTTGGAIAYQKPVNHDAQNDIATGFESVGGFFGTIENATVNIGVELSYAGYAEADSTEIFDLTAINAGAFAGRIVDSTVTFTAPFTVAAGEGVRICQTSAVTGNGLGGFVGAVKNATVQTSGNATITLNNVYVKNTTGATATNSIGGLAGYAENAKFNFTSTSACTIVDFTSELTYGNVAGAIGYYVGDSTVDGVVLNYTSVEGTTTASAINGNAAGLIAYMYLKDCDISVENCFSGNLSYHAKDTASLGVGMIYGRDENATVTLKDIIVVGVFVNTSNPKVEVVYLGCFVGSVDANLNLEGTVNGSNQFTTAAYFNYGNRQDPTYVGGAIGAVRQTRNVNYKVNITNILVGNPGYNGNAIPYNYGGILGAVGQKSSVCLDGKIYMNGGNAVNFKGNAYRFYALNPEVARTTFGQVVGRQDYSLIYLQPTAELVKSTQFRCDEIGNYGAVFRNGNWDGTIGADGLPVDNSDEATWLIQDHQVTGAWKYDHYDAATGQNVLKLETVGDWMRFAIFGNTANWNQTTGEISGYYPVGMDVAGAITQYSMEDMYWVLRVADFAVKPGTYDLTNCGIISMFRNLENVAILNSFYGEVDGAGNKPIIKNKVTAYMQSYIGLFPCVNGSVNETKTSITFDNLHIQYDVTLEKVKYCNNSVASDRNIMQIVGGLSAVAVNNIIVSDVEYDTTIYDNKNPANGSYCGGLFGMYNGVEGKSLTLENITANVVMEYARKYARVGGVIGSVTAPGNGTHSINATNITIGGTITGTNSETGSSLMASGFITEIMAGNSSKSGIQTVVTVDGMKIDGFKVCASDTTLPHYSIGGFLGFLWNCCDVTLANVSIGTDAPSEIIAKTSFGGLVQNVRGKMALDGVTYGANTVLDACGGGVNSALVVREGENLYLDVNEYDVEQGVTVKNYTGTHFDELVGSNMGGDGADRGGIVSINVGTTYHLGRNSAAYKCYEYGANVVFEGGTYKVNTRYNKNTRYYYDLDQLDYSVDYTTMDSAEDVMVWHVMHYANDYVRDYCLTDTLAHATIPTNYTITGTIDMSGYSIYPTSLSQAETYQGTSGAKIVFDAQNIYAGEKTLAAAGNGYIRKIPSDGTHQHYMLQTGLFGNLYAGLSVDGLTVSGTYSRYAYSGDYMAGGLVAGNIMGVELPQKDEQGRTLYDKNVVYQFTNITLDDLWCVDSDAKYKKASSQLNFPLGLMISKIAAGAQVRMDGIYMTGYEDVDANSDGVADYSAASSLIGVVGDGNATYMSVIMKNMDIMDAAAGKSSATLNSSLQEEALAKSSLIYRYEYSANSSVIYTFTEEDYMVGKLGKTADAGDSEPHIVTLGVELGDRDVSGTNYAEIEYFDTANPVGKSGDVLVSEIPYASSNYIPYVFTGGKEILVNPKVESITQGCGTYEDPYIIDSPVQLISIYRYLYDEETYAEIFGLSGYEWQMHATGKGTDDVLCDLSEAVNTGHGPLLNYKVSGFPTKEQLSQAYYLISKDIDLSSYSEFIGFGRTNQPFVGVFVGRKADDSKPVVTLSAQSSVSNLPAYGLIQTAKGAVVKDLTIHIPTTVKVGNDNGKCMAGGVIAHVIGGDNIIEGVSVTGNGVGSFEPQRAAASIGGYVGVVELGGVIIRDMPAGTMDGIVVTYPVDTDSMDYPEPAEYVYVGGIVGNVLDGYVVCETSESGEELFADTNAASAYSSALPMCNTYDILNSGYLKSTASQIAWDNSTYEIADNKQLQIMSMALNSGFLNYESGTDSDVPYNESSRQRNGDYSFVGKVGDAGFATAFADTKAENGTGVADSYLIQFYNCTGGSHPKNTTLASGGNVLTYELTGSTYDMSGFKKGFRGFGARYHGTEYTVTKANGTQYNNTVQVADPTLLFQSHFRGSDSDNPVTIILDMHVTAAMDSPRVGLLNEIPQSNSSALLKVENIILKGTVINEGSDVAYDEDYDVNFEYWIANKEYNAGGLASDVITSMSVKNVSVQDLTVKATGNAGGFFGVVKEAWNTNIACQNVEIDGLSVAAGTLNYAEGVQGGHAGGIIGKMKVGGYNGSRIYIGADNTFEKDTYSGITGTDIEVSTHGRNASAGGLVGYVDALNIYAIKAYVYNTTLTNLKVYTANRFDEIGMYAGGIIGCGLYLNAEMYNTVVGSDDANEYVDIQLKWENDTTTNGVLDTSDVKQLNEKSAAGGFIGYTTEGDNGITITNCAIKGHSGNGGSTTLVKGYGRSGGFAGKTGDITITDSTVGGIEVQSLCYAGGAVGELIYGTGTMQGLQVLDSTIHCYAIVDKLGNAAGGYIGYIPSGAEGVSVSPSLNSDNKVRNSYICGQTVGGVFGFYNTVVGGMSDIAVTANKIVAKPKENSIMRGSNAGGFAGQIATSLDMADCIENLTISDNLITGELDDSDYLGGVLGIGKANLYFYNIKLKDNYLGYLPNNEELPDDEKIDIVAESIDDLKQKLYWKYLTNSYKLISDISDEEAYKYSLQVGNLSGRKSNSAYINYFIGVNVQYTDAAYMPFADVGLISSEPATLTNYTQVREIYRDGFFIVYDAMETEHPLAGGQPGEYHGFSNVEAILTDYKDETISRAYAYDLHTNYLEGALSLVSVEDVCELTYHDGTKYQSEFKLADDSVFPMVVFRSSASGSLDEVLQTYINVLSNNSGAINSYEGQDIVVSTKAMKLVDGVVEENTDNPTAVVKATETSNKYVFDNKSGENRLYDTMTNAKNATFTLITVEYQYDGETKWTMEIPVYVEQRLEYNTHMRFVEGIEYNIDTIKNGQYVPGSAEQKAAVALDAGSSYSLYLEYIYGETRELYPGKTVPKVIYMDSQYNIPFLSGTRMTLIDLEDNGKTYYYTVGDADGSAIDFASFTDGDGNNYVAKHVNENDVVSGNEKKCTYKDSFIDVCGNEKNDVTMERYVLLVDTDAVQDKSRTIATYELRMRFAEDDATEETFRWIDKQEHCTVMISETQGMISEFVTAQTTVATDSVIGDDGQVVMDITYDITLDGAWLGTNAGLPRYFDIGIGISGQVDGGQFTIPVPIGTVVTFEAPTTDANGDTVYETVGSCVVQGQDSSKVYFYENSGFKNLMQMSPGTTTESVRVTMDFSAADLSGFADMDEDTIYHVSAELIETTDKENPEIGKVKDTFLAQVGLQVVSDISLVVEPTDLMTLGVNRFQPEETDKGVIPFEVKIAFPTDGYTEDALEDKYYTIVFKTEQKMVNDQTGETEYQEYNGNLIEIYSGTVDPTAASGDGSTGGNQGGAVVGTPIPITYNTMQFADITLGEIKETEYTLYAKEGLDFTNYRVRAYLIISDSAPTQAADLEVGNELQNDFFIYTVAKVKTDLE